MRNRKASIRTIEPTDYSADYFLFFDMRLNHKLAWLIAVCHIRSHPVTWASTIQCLQNWREFLVINSCQFSARCLIWDSEYWNIKTRFWDRIHVHDILQNVLYTLVSEIFSTSVNYICQSTVNRKKHYSRPLGDTSKF